MAVFNIKPQAACFTCMMLFLDMFPGSSISLVRYTRREEAYQSCRNSLPVGAQPGVVDDCTLATIGGLQNGQSHFSCDFLGGFCGLLPHSPALSERSSPPLLPFPGLFPSLPAEELLLSLPLPEFDVVPVGDELDLLAWSEDEAGLFGLPLWCCLIPP